MIRQDRRGSRTGKTERDSIESCLRRGYKTTAGWQFAGLADVWGGRGFDVRTPRQLRAALAAAWNEDRFTILEVTLQPGDISRALAGFVRAFGRRVSS